MPWKREIARGSGKTILRVDLLQRLHSRSDAALAASGAKRCQGPSKEMAQLTMLLESTCSHLYALFTCRVFVLGCIRAAFLLCKACSLKNLVFALEMWSLKPQNPLSNHRGFPSTYTGPRFRRVGPSQTLHFDTNEPDVDPACLRHSRLTGGDYLPWLSHLARQQQRVLLVAAYVWDLRHHVPLHLHDTAIAAIFQFHSESRI